LTLWRGDGAAQTRYTLRRNTASIMKGFKVNIFQITSQIVAGIKFNETRHKMTSVKKFSIHCVNVHHLVGFRLFGTYYYSWHKDRMKTRYTKHIFKGRDYTNVSLQIQIS